MSKLIYNSENKRIALATPGGVSYIPDEDTENERITITSRTEPIAPDFTIDEDGFATIDNQEITSDYLDPALLNLEVDEDGYITL